MFLRTADPLIISLAKGRARVSSPRCAHRIDVAPVVLQVLAIAEGGVESESAFRDVKLGQKELVTVVKRLRQLGFLCSEVAEDASVPLAPPWDAWGGAAWSFDRSTRDVNHLTVPAEIEAYVTAITKTEQPAPSASNPRAPIIMLPRVWSALDDVPLKRVLEERRSHRTFTGETISLDAVSTLLHYSFAPLRFAECGPMGVLELRSSASAGARHELGAYVVAFDVEGVSPGIYRYDQLRHGLVPVRSEASREAWEEHTFRQGFFTTGAFAVVIISDAHQMSWKYRHARGYRMLMQNVGHAAQVFIMIATALDLGCAITSAFRDSRIEAELELPLPSQMAMFVMVCGYAAVDAAGGPVDYALPAEPWDPTRRSRL